MKELAKVVNIRWRRVAIVYAINVAIALAFDFLERSIPSAGFITWPGMGAAFVTMLPFHTSFWDHPYIVSTLAALYNASLYSLVIWGASHWRGLPAGPTRSHQAPKKRGPSKKRISN